MGKHWYVVHTYSGHENKVKQNLERKIEKFRKLKDEIFNVKVPTEEVVEMKEGKKKTSERKIFPGYVLIEMELSDDARRIVKSTPGVTNFVGSGGKPIPLSDTEVDNIEKIGARKERPRPKVAFERGESVKVIDGPFTNFTGKVEEVNPSKGKLKVSISVFGRATPVELDFLQVGKL